MLSGEITQSIEDCFGASPRMSSQITSARLLSSENFPGLLELWASIRIWPMQVLHVLMACGYRPQLRASIDARIVQIVHNPFSDWRRPTA
jgi:hypothetical protein